LAFFGLRAHYESELPSVAELHDIHLGQPLRIYSGDAKLIGEFGAERREPLRFDQLPQPLIEAFLAAEDDRFFEHPGFDWQGLARAGWILLTTGEKRQGGSTITMQLARNVFLTPERSFVRKFKEVLLALKIERELSKQEILELYLNRIFLGNRAYGVGAAAEVYFGKKVPQLTLSEMATIAALPKAPSRDNPLANPERSRERRDYVLRRMRELNFINADALRVALAEPITAHEHSGGVDIDAHYVAEMARAEIFAKYGEAAYTAGYAVTTTIDSKRQNTAVAAVRSGILAYTDRHGYIGAEGHLPSDLLNDLQRDPNGELIQEQLAGRAPVAGLVPAIVLDYTPLQLRVLTDKGALDLPKTAFDWAHISDKRPLKAGDFVRLSKAGDGWRLAQLPLVQGAFIAVDPRSGAVQALVGGYDFFTGAYNRVVQARRQVGSGFKPFLYTAALSRGYTPASVFLDAPVVFTGINPDDDWRPGNYEGKFNGPMRLRDALAKSRNLVSVRVAQAIGIGYVRDFVPRFGIPKDRLPDDLTIALGSASLTPWEMARAYSVIANGGFYVEPYLIQSIRDGGGNEIFHADPKLACPACDLPPVDSDDSAAAAAAAHPIATAAATKSATPALTEAPLVDEAHRAKRVLDAPLDWLITSMMHDVVTRGTAADVRQLGRDDLSGKTGTTNDFTDAWFNGFNNALVAITWIGFDQPKPLGRGEVGGHAALPVWMDFMKVALKGMPSQVLPRPPGLVSIPINPLNGKLLPADTPGAMIEVVQSDHVPPADDGHGPNDETNPATSIY
ncbi:MAG: penicillin-binding protein, partial [Nevskia sp.]|nr:penicillin-binding protein [Nevskia sp.]